MGCRTAGVVIVLLTLPAISSCRGTGQRTDPFPRPAQGFAECLSPAEFSRLIQDLSEPGGDYPSDNFVSNETSYLHVVGRLKQLNIAGGAYLGVGPEQNFTYIARIRPHIAFIVDIRRQAMIQHLLYKAVFRLAANRAEFLEILLCRPLERHDTPPPEAPTERLLEEFDRGPAPQKIFAANLARIRGLIQEEFQYPLSARDHEELEALYAIFRKEGLGISYQTQPTDAGDLKGFPTLKDLVLQTDLNGDLGSFLATEEDFLFVKDLHQRNLIIPIVGDFAGSKALAGVGKYLRKNGYLVRAFYVSNVEQFLFESRTFDAFVENVRTLPVDQDSVFIRAFALKGRAHPASVPGHLTGTVLQTIPAFLKDDRDGLHASYDDLVANHFIVGVKR